MDFLRRIRFSANLSRSSISFLLQLTSFRKSFELAVFVGNLKSFFSSASTVNLSASLTNSQTLSWREIFFCFPCSSSFVFIFLFNYFLVAFFFFKVSSWNCSYLNRALLTDFIISAVMVILLAVTSWRSDNCKYFWEKQGSSRTGSLLYIPYLH